MWDTKILNRSNFPVIANGVSIGKDEEHTINYDSEGVNIQVSGRGEILALNPESGFENHVSTTSAIKIISGTYVAYVGYDNHTVISIFISANGTFTINDFIKSVPIEQIEVDHAAFINPGSYIYMSNNNAYDFGTGDFTIGFFTNTIIGNSPIIERTGMTTVGGLAKIGYAIYTRSDNILLATSQGSPHRMNRESVSNIPNSYGTWHHIAASRENGKYYIFLDGKKMASEFEGTNQDVNVNSSGQLLIGKSLSEDAFFKGYIKDINIWNRALSESEIIPTMFDQLHGTEPGLVGLWKLNENTKDASPTKNDAMFNGLVQFKPLFNCVNINGANAHSYCTIDSMHLTSHEVEMHSRIQHVYINSNAPYLYAVLTKNDGTTDFPTGVQLKISNPHSIEFNQSIDDENLLVLMEHNSIRCLLIKNPQPGKWTIELTAPNDIGFNFDFQTLPSKDITSTMMGTLQSAYTHHGVSRHLMRRSITKDGWGYFDAALGITAVLGATVLTIIAAPMLATGTALATPAFIALLATTTAVNAIIYMKASYNIGLERAARKLLGFANFIKGPAITVHIWSFRYFNFAYGHASLTLSDGTHISWWPTQENIVPLNPVLQSNMPLLENNYASPAYPNQTFADDCDFEGMPPDYSIKISILDETKIKTWWQNFKTTHQWRTLDQNCSTTVKDALFAGGNIESILSHNQIVNFQSVAVWKPNNIANLAYTLARYNPA